MKIKIGKKKIGKVNRKVYLVFEDVLENEKNLMTKLGFGYLETWLNKHHLAELNHFNHLFLDNFHRLNYDFKKLEEYLKKEEGFTEISKKVLSWEFMDFMKTLYNIKDYINTLEFKGSNLSRENYLLKVYSEDELYEEIKKQYIKLIRLIKIGLKEFFDIDYKITVKNNAVAPFLKNKEIKDFLKEVNK